MPSKSSAPSAAQSNPIPFPSSGEASRNHFPSSDQYVSHHMVYEVSKCFHYECPEPADIGERQADSCMAPRKFPD